MDAEDRKLKRGKALRLLSLRELHERKASAALAASRRAAERSQAMLLAARQRVAKTETELASRERSFYGAIVTTELDAEAFDVSHAGMERLAVAVVGAVANAERIAEVDQVARRNRDEKAALHRRALRRMRGSNQLVERIAAEIALDAELAAESANEEILDARAKGQARGSGGPP